MATMPRCWWCGVPAREMYDVTSFGLAGPIVVINWPADTDHKHLSAPPSPAELAAEADASLARLLAILAD